MDALSKPHEQNTEAGKRPQEPAHRVDVRPATRQDLAAVLALLEANQLPTVGVREHFQHFLVAYDGTTLVGSAGLEIYGRAGLLRSVAVAAPYRSQGLGRQLGQSMLALARHT
jgi:amino-acid N-acetyltransferase